MIIAKKAWLIAVAILVLSGTVQAAEVPTLDVSRTCKPLSPAVAIDPDRCYRAEREAREELAKEWAGFPAGDRSMCTVRATMGGAASYVALLTCLEMKRDVAKLPADLGLATRPAALPIR